MADLWREAADAEGRPLSVTIHDRTLASVEALDGEQSVALTLRAWGISTGTITLHAGHPRVPLLVDPGTRLHIVTAHGHDLGSWRVVAASGSVTGAAPVVLSITADTDLLWRATGWPVPSAPITQQGQRAWQRTGPVEDVWRAVMLGVAGRWTPAEPMEVAPSAGRGERVRLWWRFHTLADRLMPPLEASGLIPTATLAGGRVRHGLRAGRAYPVPLTLESGALVGGDWAATAPAATHVIIGGPGEDADRIWDEATRPITATTWAVGIDTVLDARDVDGPHPADPEGGTTERTVAQVRADLHDRALAAMTDLDSEAAHSRVTVSAQLAETAELNVGPGPGVWVGDTVQVHTPITAGPTAQRVTEVQVTWNAEDGLVKTATVGERSRTLWTRLDDDLARLHSAARSAVVNP